MEVIEIKKVSTPQKSSQNLTNLSKAPTIEAILLPFVQNASALDISNFKMESNQKLAFQIIQRQRTLTIAETFTAKRVFQGDPKLNEKMACAILARFNESLSVSKRMEVMDVYETAIAFLDRYTHDSIEDLVLCLKMAKDGKLGIIYNRIDQSVIAEFLQKYFDMKYRQLEAAKMQEKATLQGDYRTEVDTDIRRAELAANDKSSRQQKIIDAQAGQIKRVGKQLEQVKSQLKDSKL